MVVNCGCWSLEWERGRGPDNGIFYGGRWFYDDGGQHTGEKEVGCW